MFASGRFKATKVDQTGTSKVTVAGAAGPVSGDLQGISKLYIDPVDGGWRRQTMRMVSVHLLRSGGSRARASARFVRHKRWQVDRGTLHISWAAGRVCRLGRILVGGSNRPVRAEAESASQVAINRPLSVQTPPIAAC